jgi:hypothetical protein
MREKILNEDFTSRIRQYFVAHLRNLTWIIYFVTRAEVSIVCGHQQLGSQDLQPSHKAQGHKENLNNVILHIANDFVPLYCKGVFFTGEINNFTASLN